MAMYMGAVVYTCFLCLFAVSSNIFFHFLVTFQQSFVFYYLDLIIWLQYYVHSADFLFSCSDWALY